MHTEYVLIILYKRAILYHRIIIYLYNIDTASRVSMINFKPDKKTWRLYKVTSNIFFEQQKKFLDF